MPAKPKRKKLTREATPSTVAELNVERMSLSSLKPHPKNPRIHPKPNSPEWEVLRKSLEHDYFDPLVWNKRNGMLVSGHLRRKVFATMGVKQADVVVVDYSETTHLARMIAANKSIGVDDAFKLGAIMDDLGKVEDFDFSLTGFTLEAAEGLSASEAKEGLDDEDASAEEYSPSDIDKITEFFGKGAVPTVKTATKQVWRVGDHYLYVGSVLSDHETFTPLLVKLKAEFPTRKILLVPMPDPLMVGCTDPKVAAVFVQPSPLAASLALSLLKKQKTGHRITLLTDDNSKKTAKKRGN